MIPCGVIDSSYALTKVCDMIAYTGKIAVCEFHMKIASCEFHVKFACGNFAVYVTFNDHISVTLVKS